MRYYRINNTVYFPVRVRQSSCPSPKSCPYLRGESPTTLLHQRDYLKTRVDEMENVLNLAQKEIASLKERFLHLEEENKKLTEDLSYAKQSLIKKLFHKTKPSTESRPRGSPFGHPGTSRKKPDSIDEYVTVPLEKCPNCSSVDISLCKHFDTQEDIVIHKVVKRCFVHLNYWCPHCRKTVYTFAENELPHSPIGPVTKAVACFLHYQIKVSYDDVQKIFQNLFNLTLSPGSLIGFDNKLYQKALPLYESIRKMLPSASSDFQYTPNINADETSWKKGWLWVFTNKQLAYYHIDKHRSGSVVQEHLGSDYKGILTSDFFSSYNSSINAFAKQKCSAHLLRDIKELEEKFPDDSVVISFCMELKTLIQDAILLHSQFSNLTLDEWESYKKPLFSHLNELSQIPVPHPKADTLRKRLLKHKGEIFTFLEHPEIEPTNNMAERALRNLVMLRKITLGNRSEQGEKNVACMATILQTSKLKGLSQIEVLQTLLTKGLTNDLAQKFNLPQARSP